MQVSQNYGNNTTFGKFYKVKGSQQDIKHLKNRFFRER